MRYIIDLHIHSRFANATSPSLNINSISEFGLKKGINLLGTGDFTHPVWLNELENNLEYEQSSGFFKHKNIDIYFTPTTEVNLAFSDNGRYKKIHFILIAPDFKIVDKINKELGKYGNLSEDGRPTLLLSAQEMVKILMNISDNIEIIPAHIWTPWFGIMAKRFGYPNLEDCFKDQMKYIHAIETGLSSDPYMNWLVKDMDNMTIVSFSDAHSLPRIGREATIIDRDFSYKDMIKAIRENNIESTIEFFPEEGKYHYSGHRKCHYFALPEEDLKSNGICPICKKKMTQGVYRRVYDLALQQKTLSEVEEIEAKVKRSKEGFVELKNKKPFVRLIPLDEIIAKSIGIKSAKAKKVIDIYNELVLSYGKELDILLYPSKYDDLKLKYPDIYKNILNVLNDKLTFTPGYDNTYGNFEFTQ